MANMNRETQLLYVIFELAWVRSDVTCREDRICRQENDGHDPVSGVRADQSSIFIAAGCEREFPEGNGEEEAQRRRELTQNVCTMAT